MVLYKFAFNFNFNEEPRNVELKQQCQVLARNTSKLDHLQAK